VPVVTQLPDRADDGLWVERHAYAAPHDPEAVVLILVVGGGHTWPGSTARERWLGPSTLDVDANELMWAYFEPRTAGPRAGAAGGGHAAATAPSTPGPR
jgi:polyhydroxybutyrate depolymerase